MNQPKPDPKLRECLARIRNMHEFREYQRYVDQLDAYYKHLLVQATPADVPHLQGRIRQLNDLSNLIKESA